MYTNLSLNFVLGASILFAGVTCFKRKKA